MSNLSAYSNLIFHTFQSRRRSGAESNTRRGLLNMRKPTSEGWSSERNEVLHLRDLSLHHRRIWTYRQFFVFHDSSIDVQKHYFVSQTAPHFGSCGYPFHLCRRCFHDKISIWVSLFWPSMFSVCYAFRNFFKTYLYFVHDITSNIFEFEILKCWL